MAVPLMLGPHFLNLPFTQLHPSRKPINLRYDHPDPELPFQGLVRLSAFGHAPAHPVE